MDAPDPDACSLPRATVEARHATARAIVADVAREIADPDLRVVDPMDALCDARRCRAVINGYLMYRDDNHLTVEGANYVWARVEPRNLRSMARHKRVEPDSDLLARRESPMTGSQK